MINQATNSLIHHCHLTLSYLNTRLLLRNSILSQPAFFINVPYDNKTLQRKPNFIIKVNNQFLIHSLNHKVNQLPPF